MEITRHIIARMAPPEIVRKGERYFRQGRVKLTEVGANFVAATVRGTRLYDVTIQREGRDLQTSCTCPFTWGEECKHVTAVLFALLGRTDAAHDNEPDLLRQLLGPAEGGPQGTRRPPAWARSVSRILSQPALPRPSSLDWRLGFSLLIDGQSRRVQPIRIKVRKDGTDGQAVVLVRIDHSDFEQLDRDQRLLLTMLLPTASSDFPELPRGATPAWIKGSPGRYPYNREDSQWNDILLLLQNQHLYLREKRNVMARRLTVDPRPGHPEFSLSEAGGELTLYPEVEWNGTMVPVSDDLVVIAAHPLWVLAGDQVRRIEGITGEELRQLQRVNSPLVVPARDREAFLNNALPRLLTKYRLRSTAMGFEMASGSPTPRLYLQEWEGLLHIDLRFLYGTVEAPAPATIPESPDIFSSKGVLITLHRDQSAELAARARLHETGLRVTSPEDHPLIFTPNGDPLEWLAEQLPVLHAEGFEVYGQEHLRRYRVRTAPSRAYFGISSGIDWFDLTVDISFDGVPVPLEAFMKALRERKRFVRLSDGTYGMLPQEWLRRFALAMALGNQHGQGLRYSRAQLPLLEDLGENGESSRDEGFESLRRALASFNGIADVPLPNGFAGTLRPYQQAGFNWLVFMHENRLGALLADDMGLGKTIQALALLQHLHGGDDRPPSLIVVPTSLVHNWEREASRFTPSLRVLIYHGLDRKYHRNAFASFDVVITSYGILRRDAEFLSGMEFSCVILDESQNIKNFSSANARAARHLSARFRLALTGTPVENNLRELWSQFHFLNPGMLGGLRTFTESFARPIERDHDDTSVSILRRMIHPFILRRTKELVAGDLPPKMESVIVCDMDEHQRSAYNYWREYYRQAIVKSVEAVGLRRSTVKVLEGLTKLRLVCCHPLLLDEQYRGTSAKHNIFEEMLDNILSEGHKVLVFSQFVRMLTILRRHLERKGILYEYLDGRTVHRKERVDHFQNDDDVKVFLISLRAGGTGLNLTSADYVIHYDPWWNPAAEAQATDRTHRIGQTRQVFSYKLITRDTVEEKVVALQERKKALVGSVITTDESFLKSLTREDLENLFR